MAYRDLEKNLGQTIFVVGCARSFTSMIGEILYRSGIFAGRIGGTKNPHNPNGMFENLDLREKVVKPYLRKHGFDPRGQKPLVNYNKHYPDNTIRSETIKILYSQGLKPGQSWFYKEPKLCMVWRAWNENFPNAYWVVVKRRLSDTAISCFNTRFLTAYNNSEEWFAWAAKHELALNALKSEVENVFEVWPEKILCGHFSEVRALCSFLGVAFRHKNISKCVNKKAWHYGANTNR
jgi:hypothetical protein